MGEASLAGDGVMNGGGDDGERGDGGGRTEFGGLGKGTSISGHVPRASQALPRLFSALSSESVWAAKQVEANKKRQFNNIRIEHSHNVNLHNVCNVMDDDQFSQGKKNMRVGRMKRLSHMTTKWTCARTQ